MNSRINWKYRISIIYTVLYYTWTVQANNSMLGPSDQPEAYFNGSSYIRLQTTISLKRQTGLSFKTCLGGELFSQQHNENRIELSVSAEGISFVAKTMGKQFEEIVKGNFINNKWHTVYLQYRLGNLTLDVDGEITLLANSTYRNELLTSSALYNEGAVLIIGKHYIGCMLEGPSIVFNESLIHNLNVQFRTCPIPDDDCAPLQELKLPAHFDHCLTEPCMRHGTCINGDTTYSCDCSPRYTGKNCEIDLGSPCERSPAVCKNNAKCNEDLMGYFICTCAPGFTGKHCDEEIQIHPLCATNICMNGGTCEIHQNTAKAECVCVPGYVGVKCEINLNECQSNPCKNGGICLDGVANYTCDCSHTGYMGNNCEININECLTNPCLNHGTCFDTYGSYLCQCAVGFDGPNCQFSINECMSQPCQNHGVCVDQSGKYSCRCLPGYAGDHCEMELRQNRCEDCPFYADCIDTNGSTKCTCKPEYVGVYPNCSKEAACSPGTCKNGGVCIPWNGSYNCSCQPGYSGSACERVELCSHNTCHNGGTCMEDHSGGVHCVCPEDRTGSYCENPISCVDRPCMHASSCQDYPGTFYCTCEPGWTGVNCGERINLCSGDPCLNGGTCIDQQMDYFSCNCPPGFTGARCQVNENDCASMPCLNGGLCIDKVNGFYCNCTEDWMGTICEVPYDVCQLKPCLNNGTCMAGMNKHEFSCSCFPGFEGEKCQIDVNDCVGVSCPPGKVCVDLVNKYECQCPPGYKGDNCSVDADPCSRENHCKNGATCSVDPTTYAQSCVCSAGFTGALCEQDIDECELSGTSICNHGICVNKQGGFQCYCMPGYTGERCNLDFDECLSAPCRYNATCINKINNYECICPPGYTGKDCHININECDPMPCMAGSTCIDGIDEFTCICQPGLTGKLCHINIDDCLSSPCLNGAHCIDGLNSYTCNCTDTGYKGIHCEINIDECAGNPCVNGGECVDEVKNYHCNCYLGYVGKHCEEDINDCESNPCKYSGTCLEKSNMTLYHPNIISKLNVTLPEPFNRPFDYADAAGYECLCIPGITGKNCEIDINECESSPCFSGTCRDGIGRYSCDCEEGFEGEHCDIDIDECEKYQPCVHGTCIDRIANYYCDCEPNYGGKNCSVPLIGCMDDPCLNGGTCKPYLMHENQHKFNCSCPNGFHGVTCEKVTTMSLSGNSSVTVNTTREEGYDIQFRFKTTLGDGILALGKGLTYYILELSRGRLNLHTSLLNKWEGVFIGSNLNDSNWQKVFVAINSSHLVLSANDEQNIYTITFNENYNVTSTSFPTTYIGGIPSNVNLRKLTHGQPFLVGCTEDVLINGEWVLPEMKNTSGLEFQDVDVGCHRKEQCNPNPCHSGGHCTDKWRDFACTCERPYLGHTCQYNYTAATFGHENVTDSLVTVDVTDAARRAVRNIVDISMFIRTRQPRGQIFYLGSALNSPNDETYIAAQLESGELLMRIHFNGTTEAYTVGGVKLDNGYNHLIQVIRNVTLVQVKLNDTEYFRKTISATGSLDAQVLYLGGQPQLRPVRHAAENSALHSKNDIVASTGPAAVATPLSMVHFKGIIQDVQISNGSKVMVVEFFPLKIEELNIPPLFGNVSFDKNLVLEGVHSDNSCRINPCHHNGMCHNTWNDYRCECIRGFKGKDCTEQEFCELEHCPPQSECRNLEDGYECIANATFDGQSPPLMYSLTVLPNSTEELRFDFLELSYRTRSWGTVLFAKYLDNYFVIFVYHNQVVVEWHTNGVTVNKGFQKDHFVGQWLTIYFEVKDYVLRGGFKEMVMDESPSFEVTDFDAANVTEIFARGTVYVAGSDDKSFDYKMIIKGFDANVTSFVPFDVTTDAALTSNSVELPEHASSFDYQSTLYKIDVDKSTDRFKGCLGEIRVSKLLLPYFRTSELYPHNRYSEEFFELISKTEQNIGCVLCHDSDCFNEGHCISPNVTYKCDCPLGFAADDCSIDINECENNQCENNSTCIDEIGRYECKCVPGYEGVHCEHEIDECESNPCQNGGICFDGLDGYTCNCTEDYVGSQCEILKLVTCENEPCRLGATCKDGRNDVTGNNFTCICMEGMEGPLCDTPYCLKKHCENGYCNTTEQVPICQCQHGFEGKYCEINIDDCVLASGKSPCQNGGVCIDGISRYDCNCTGTGYTGLLCENDIDECKTVRMPCGRGICANIPGNYRCICSTDSKKCGHFCAMDDPCKENPCGINGECESNCTDIPDYICHCHENFTGKNCTESVLDAERQEGGVNILYIIIPVIVILVVAVAIGMAILVNIARSKRATRGTYSPSAQEFCNPRVELDHVLKPPPEERLI